MRNLPDVNCVSRCGLLWKVEGRIGSGIWILGLQLVARFEENMAPVRGGA